MPVFYHVCENRQFQSCYLSIFVILSSKIDDWQEKMRMDELLKVGVIANTHGVRGELKVFPTTDDPKRFLELDQVILDTGKSKERMEIEKIRFFKNMVILKFKGLDDINDALALRKMELFVTRDQAVPLGENEYFIADLIGLSAVSDEGEELGKLSDVISSAANDIYVITKEGAPDLLVPAIKQCIKKVDMERGSIEIHLLKGLREVNQK